MGRMVIVGLSVAALIVIGLAVYVVREQESATRPNDIGERLVPELAGRVNDVTRIQVQVGEQNFSIDYVDGDWVVPDKYGYPAHEDRPRGTIYALSEIELRSAKTDDPARLGQLGLNDPGTESGASAVTLYDAEDNVLADVWLGDAALGAGIKRYVRLAGETQSWVADANVDVGEGPDDWLDRTLTKVRRERIRMVSIALANGSRFSMSRDNADTEAFDILPLPVEARPKAPTIRNISMLLSHLPMEDVKPAADLPFDGGAVVTSRFLTFDGLQVTVESVTVDERVWTRFSAEFLPGTVVEAAAAEDGEPAASNPAAPAAPDEEMVKAEVEEINTRHRGWAYRIGEMRGDHMTASLDFAIENPDEIPQATTIVPGPDEQPMVVMPPLDTPLAPPAE